MNGNVSSTFKKKSVVKRFGFDSWRKYLFISNDEEKRAYTFIYNYSKSCINYPDRNQVELDLVRSFVHFEGISRKVLSKYRKKLQHVMDYVFYHQKHLHYYQGFHDICSILVLILDDSSACVAAERLALYHLNDFMKSSMDSVLPYLNYVYVLLSKIDPDIYQSIIKTGTPPYFSLSWLLTWFSHDIKNLNHVYYLFDVILKQNPMFPLFLIVSMIHMNRQSLLAMDATDDLYQQLSKLPSCSNVFLLVNHCFQLFPIDNHDLLPRFSSIKSALEITKSWIALSNMSPNNRSAAISKHKMRNTKSKKIELISVFHYYIIVIILIISCIILILSILSISK